MEIKAVTPRGYCKGVVKAIDIAKKTKLSNPDKKVTMLGMIVHNKYVVEACEKMGIICLDGKGKTRLELLDEVDEGIVIFTAHGVSDEVVKKATEKGLEIVNATCVDVIRTHEIVKSHIDKGDVIYIGKKTHPETEGVIALSEKVHLVTSIDDIKNLKNLKNVLITNQTTMSLLDIKYLIEKCTEKYQDALVYEEICNATRVRQEAIQKLIDVDCLLVVGDTHSNNSNQLKNIALKSGVKNAYLIESANDITLEMIKDAKKVAVTSGASTPTYLTMQVLSTLENFKDTKILEKQIIEIDKII